MLVWSDVVRCVVMYGVLWRNVMCRCGDVRCRGVGMRASGR